MRKLFALGVLTLLVVSLASAQFGPAKGKMTLGPAVELSLPIGNFSDFANFGFGGVARFEYGLDNNLALTANAGYLTWGGKDVEGFSDYTNSAIPIIVGVKYGFSQGLFVSGELGLYNYNISYTLQDPYGLGYGGEYSGSSTEFMFAPGIGYQTGALEGLLRFYVLDTDLMNLSLMVAYNFNLN